MPDKDTVRKLLELAAKARENAYAPYSKFKVGAALLCNDGEIFTGCNVENAAFTPGNCAERTAVFKAVSVGKREYKAIAIVGQNGLTPPCGVCRQVLREFVNPKEFYVILGNNTNGDKSELKQDYAILTLEELLPMSFGPDNL